MADITNSIVSKAMQRAKDLGLPSEENPTPAPSETPKESAPIKEENPQHIKTEEHTKDSEPEVPNETSLQDALSGKNEPGIEDTDSSLDHFLGSHSEEELKTLHKEIKEIGEGAIKGSLRKYLKDTVTRNEQLLAENKKLQDSASSPQELDSLKQEFETLKGGYEQYKELEDSLGGFDRVKDSVELFRLATQDPKGFKDFWIKKNPTVARQFGFIGDAPAVEVTDDMVQEFVDLGLIEAKSDSDSDKEYGEYAKNAVRKFQKAMGVDRAVEEKQTLLQEVQTLKNQINNLNKPKEMQTEEPKAVEETKEAPIETVPDIDPNQIAIDNIVEVDNRLKGILRYEKISGEYHKILDALKSTEGFRELASSDPNKAEEKVIEIVRTYKQQKSEKKSTMIDQSINSSGAEKEEEKKAQSVDDIPALSRKRTEERFRRMYME